MNQVTLLGNLCYDPEIKDANGFTVANMRLAVNERKKSKEGEWIDCATFIRLVAFGKVAERAGKVLCKGTKVCVAGKVKVDSWTDRDSGAKRSETLIEVKDFELCGSRSREESQEREESRKEYNQERPPQRYAKDDGQKRYSRRDEGEYYPEYDDYN